MTDTIEQIRRLDGVMYVTEYSGNYRVVFQYDADSTTIRKIERLTGCAGRLGATQEHNPFAEYPIQEVNADD